MSHGKDCDTYRCDKFNQGCRAKLYRYPGDRKDPELFGTHSCTPKTGSMEAQMIKVALFSYAYIMILFRQR